MMVASLRCAVSLLATALLQAQDKPPQHLLRLAFTPGASEWYRDTLERSTTAVVQEAATWHCEVTREVRVVGLLAAGAELEQTTRRVVLRTKHPDVDYDSATADSDANAPRREVAPVGTVVRCVRSDRGVISDHRVPEEVKRGTNLIFLGSDGANGLFGVWPTLPEEPVAVGATWPGEVVLATDWGAECTVPAVFRLARVEHGRATIEHTVQLAERARLSGRLGVAAGSLTGESELDLARGRLLRATSTLTLQPPGAGGVVSYRCSTEVIEPPALRAGKPAAGGTGGEAKK